MRATTQPVVVFTSVVLKGIGVGMKRSFRGICAVVWWVMALGVMPMSAQAALCPDASADANNRCVLEKLKQADQQLNAAYNAALKRVSAEQTDMKAHGMQVELLIPFQQSQQLWQRQRDIQCEFDARLRTTTAWQSVWVHECRYAQTQTRIDYLEQVLATP